jgi:hypothetical protein
LGQYPANRKGVRRPYHDCKCQFHDLSNPNPNCIYFTMDDINLAKKRKQYDEDAGIEYYRLMSMYDIRNALTEKSLPLSDNIHGPYKMMPPELLHTSGSGLIMYMFESLRDQMGGGKDRDLIDRQHILISNLIKRQSERDFSTRINEEWSYLWNKMSVFRAKWKFVPTTVYCTSPSLGEAKNYR